MILEKCLIGKVAKSEHPITVLNPKPTFNIYEVRCEYKYVSESVGMAHSISVRGENTCWFGGGYWELVE